MSIEMDPALGRMYEFRDELVEDLALDVIGPGGGESEIISEAPLDRYIVGVLWPSSVEFQEPPEPDGVEPKDDEATEDSPVPQALMRYPSSVGLTFSVRLDAASKISIGVSGARYEGIAEEAKSDKKAQRNQDWRRIPLDVEPIVKSVAQSGPIREVVVDGLQLYVYVRPPRDGVTTVSVALRNTNTTGVGELRDGKSWFQVGLTIDTDSPAIVDRSGHHVVSNDEDLASAALLYRNMYTFAIGHGCAVTWDRDSAVNAAVDHVETTFLPKYDVSRARPGLLHESINLRMSFLADAPDDEVIANLTGLVGAYRDWINRLERSLKNGSADVGDALREPAERHGLRPSGWCTSRIGSR